jgi:16S rRNA (uracil1498-N3)-methyltransferase
MNRFFLPIDRIVDGIVRFPEDLSKQLRKVLRLDVKDAVIVLDNTGWEYLVQLDDVKSKEAIGHIMGKQEGRPEPQIQLSLAYSLARREKIEMIVQKATEIGVARFYPYVSSRSLVQDLKTNRARQERLEAIAREASEQSMRAHLPSLFPVSGYEEMLKQTSDHDLKLIAWEGTAIVQHVCAEMIQPLSKKANSSLVLLIGPEGGFSADEVKLAEQYGYQQISFGTNIFRTETACIAGSAILRHLVDTVELIC